MAFISLSNLTQAVSEIKAFCQAAFAPIARALPSGGASGQVLAKSSGDDYDTSWVSIPDGVTGVKGNAESSYRTGNVNLTPANIGAAASSHNHDSAYVNITGDTMTGNLNIGKSTPLLNLKNTDVNMAAANNGLSSGIHYPGVNISDNSSRIIARLEAVINSSGNNGFNLYAKNYNTSGTTTGQKGITGTINKSGTMTYSVSDPANFRSAIGAASSDSVSRTTFSITLSSGVTNADSNSSVFEKSGGVVHVSIPIKLTAAKGAWTTLFTVPSGYRPAHTFYSVALGTAPYALAFFSNGNVQCESALASGIIVYINATWLVS